MKNDHVFVDTSAFYALMDRSDISYSQAYSLFALLLEKDTFLHTNNYIVIETLALIQSRLGFEAASLWYNDVLSVVQILWIDKSIHNNAFALWLRSGKRKLSFVDCISFVTMQHYRLKKIFTFDKHFAEHGFEII